MVSCFINYPCFNNFSLLFLNGTYDWKDSIRYSALMLLHTYRNWLRNRRFWFMGVCAYNFTFVYVYRRVCRINNMGIRMFRLQVLASSANAQLIRLLRPHSIVLPHYNEKPVPDNVTNSVMGFFSSIFLHLPSLQAL